jgi:hypothetical protein
MVVNCHLAAMPGLSTVIFGKHILTLKDKFL